MLNAKTYSIMSQYENIENAAEDTLTTIEDIKLSLAEGCAVNGFIWCRQYIPKTIAKYVLRKSYTKAPGGRRKIVMQIDMEGNIVAKFPSILDATRVTGITNIDKAARGIIKKAGGYQWVYEEKYFDFKNEELW